MKTFLTFFVLLFSSSVLGGTVKGAIAHDCAELQRAYDTQDKVLLYQYKQAVLGFISGLNVGLNTNAGEDVREDTIFQIAINYCKKNPLKLVVAGADYAYDEILN